MKLCALTRRERVDVGLSINRWRGTCVWHWIIDSNSLRSATSAKEGLFGKSAGKLPLRRILSMTRFRRRRSPSPANPHHAGVAYKMDATVVALATRWSSCGWRPWVRRSLNANMEELQVFKTCEMWSVIVSLALSRTPRTLNVVTLSAPSMNGCEGGCMDLDLVRVTTSSFVLDGWIFMLLVSAHFLMLSYSSVTVSMLLEPTNR